MSRVSITRSKLDTLAATIATKSGASLPLTLDQMNTAVTNIPSGGTPRTSTDLTVSGATVTAPAGTYASDASKTVASGTEGTPTATKGTVSSHSVSVTPSVTNTAGYISGGTHSGTAVTVSASELVSGTLTVDSSGTKDVTNYASCSIPSGTAGTPSATKGTVSNHSVSVTPSVTNSTGWITGSTKTGTAVTVSASELVSGSETKTANGTYDVTNLAQLVVNVSGGGGGMNVQAYIGQTTKANNAYESTDLTLKVAKTGTYTVSWDGCRSSTSGTNGSRLYINSTAQTAYTTFDATNTRWQHVEMTGVSLTANDQITVYCRARSASYYMTVANLVIVQTA